MIKTITHLKRLMNSQSGNPRWRVTFADGTIAETKPDADVNYGIANSDRQGVPVEVTFERRLISRIEPTGPDVTLPVTVPPHFDTMCKVCKRHLDTRHDEVFPGDEPWTYRCSDHKVKG